MLLVDEILTMASIESDSFRINLTSVSLEEILEPVRNIFMFQCDQKKVNFSISVQQDLEGSILKTDPKCVKQILLNLVSNAFKFVMPG